MPFGEDLEEGCAVRGKLDVVRLDISRQRKKFVIARCQRKSLFHNPRPVIFVGLDVQYLDAATRQRPSLIRVGDANIQRARVGVETPRAARFEKSTRFTHI